MRGLASRLEMIYNEVCKMTVPLRVCVGAILERNLFCTVPEMCGQRNGGL